MQTTLRIDDELFREAKAEAAQVGLTLTRFIEDALRLQLTGVRRAQKFNPKEWNAEFQRLLALVAGRQVRETPAGRAPFKPPAVKKPDRRSAALLKALSKGRNRHGVGALRREELYDRPILR